jgi:hypothetical protein
VLRRLLLATGFLLATAAPSHADVGVIIHEPIGPLGFFTRAGHVATYLSNICPDDSPVRMRLCRPGEHGGVVSKYTPFSEHEDYDWAIVPLEEYLHGFGSPALAPVIATRNLELAIQRYQFGPLFSLAMRSESDGTLPDGEWKSTLAARFERALFIFSVSTTPADDEAIVAAFNAAPNKSRFNFFYRNCSDQAKAILDLALPSGDPIGDRIDGMTMETPKGMAKALVDRALNRPDFHLSVSRYAQLPGSFSRSREVLFPLENMYRSLGYAPYWFFGGFREVALAAMVYHQVIAPFSLLSASRDFISPRATELTLEQHQLRRRQDDVRDAFAVASDPARRRMLSELSASTATRLRALRREKTAEVELVEGSSAQWRELEGKFRTLVRGVSWTRFAPREALDEFEHYDANGDLSGELLRYVEARGTFEIQADRGAWLTLPLGDGEVCSTGVSESQLLDGDPRLAALILASAIDYNLGQPDGRRDEFARVSALVTLFQEAVRRIESIA